MVNNNDFRYSKRSHRFSPLDAVWNARWNAFEDFSAFRTYFALAVILTVLVGLWGLFTAGVNRVVCYGIISTSALLPLYFWVNEKAKGLPIYPIYALTFYPTFALQFIINEEISDTRGFFHITGEDLYATSAAVALFLLFGCLCWYLISSRPQKHLDKLAVMSEARMTSLMLVAFTAASIITAGIATEQFTFLQRLTSILVALTNTVGAVSAFMLAYLWGGGKLSKFQLLFFLTALGLSLTATAASLLLIGAISTIMVTMAGYILGRRRVPWAILIGTFCAFYILHAGKGDMREKYWSKGRAVASVSFIDYPTFFFEWVKFGFENLGSGNEIMKQAKEERQESEDLLERSSLLEVFLSAYKAAPDAVPYLKGETYQAIPTLLIPRFLYPDKPIAHIGQQTLNIHFGIQSRAEVQGTFIAWGLFNEAYANYGWQGVIGMGALLGLFFGWVAHLAAGAPFLSYRGLLSVMTLGFAFQVEMVAGVWFTAYVQSFLILTAARLALMKSQLLPTADMPALEMTPERRKPYYLR